MLPNDVLRELVRLCEAGEAFALATLVDTHGSTPQKGGARLIVRRDGTMTGTLGGGCIEADAYAAATEVLASGEPRVLDFELTEDIAVDYGLACGGRERILVAPIAANAEDVELGRALLSATDSGRRGMLATIVSAGDAALVGRSAALWEDGTNDGRLGALAAAVRDAARAALAEAHPAARLVRLGGADVFIEPIAPPVEVIIVGGGHVGLAVATAARLLGHAITVIDDRADFANTDRFPGARVVVGDVDRALDDYPVSRSSAIVIVTRGHKSDYQALSAAVRSPAFYVGLMGSRRKVALIYRQLIADGIDEERLRAVHAPIGLNIGAVTPEEIALSVMAEITMCRLGGDGATMRIDPQIIERQRPRTPA